MTERKKDKMKFTVLSDIHYTSPEMLTETADPEKHLMSKVSRAALYQAAKEDTDVMLLTGDLTNTGDRLSHDELIKILRDIVKSGKKVYVTTATHDYHHFCSFVAKDVDRIKYTKKPWDEPFFDPEKEDYSKIVEEKYAELPKKDLVPSLVETYSLNELWELYYEFGPKQAVSVCEEAHSYCVELSPDTWCLMLNDDFRNVEQGNSSATYSPICLKWIKSVLDEAKEKGIFVFACSHHPLVPPLPAYRIGADYKNMRKPYVGHMLADMGINLAFTGHTHFSDIGFLRSDKGNLLCDITTPSVRFYPPEYRVADLDGKNGKISVRSVEISDIEGEDLGGKTVKEHIKDEFIDGYRKKIAAMKPPLNKLISDARVKHLYPLCKRAAGLTPDEYNQIKDIHIFDVLMTCVTNMLGGDGEYTPDTPTYKFMMGLCAVLDSIIETQPFYDVRKNVLKGYTVSEIIEPMLFNNFVPDRNADFDFTKEPEKKMPTPVIVDHTGEVLMTLLSLAVLPLLKVAPVAAAAALPGITVLHKLKRKKNSPTPEKYYR